MELSKAQRLAGVGSWQWDPKTDTVTWSDELYRIAGRDPKLPAVAYADHPGLYTTESWERLRTVVNEALRNGTPYEIDLEMIRADGSTCWVTASGEAEQDPMGRVVQLRGTVQDITERKHAQEALRESEERLRLAAEAGRMYAFEWDRESDVIVRSAEFAHILGLDNQTNETTCKEMLDSVHPDDRGRVVAATEACTPENPSYRVQYRVIRPDGSLVWLEKNAHAFFDRKKFMYRVIGMVADITERKAAEEAVSGLSRRLIEAQEAERARIARDLHDDIGQRLALTLVTLEQLKTATNSQNGVSDKIDELRRQIAGVSRGVHNLSHQLHSATLRHLGVARAIRGFCGELSEQQSVEINYSYDNVPGNVTPEISLCLFRVVQEALHNAVKYSRVRRFDVELRGTCDAISLVVRDSGVGFDPNILRKGNGGLGLVSMQERLKLVNGHLSIDSRINRGTVVRARVPLSATNGNAMRATP
jgi:PAS domain S-box-containing protein